MARFKGLGGFEDLVGHGQIGGARPYQEDDYWITVFSGRGDSDVLMVLADGMGGHRGGDVASLLAVEEFPEAFEKAGGTMAERLRAALDSANAAIGRHAAENVHCRGMGCTLVALVVTQEGCAHWISVGDSPLWLLPAGADGGESTLERLNEDHSMRPVLEKLASRGRIAPEEVDAGSHQLRSAVMGDALSMVDEGRMVRLARGDRILLASDGLETLPEAEISRICHRNQTVAEVVSELLEEVENAARPGQDNATVLAYEHARASAVRSRLAKLTARTRPMRPLDAESSGDSGEEETER